MNLSPHFTLAEAMASNMARARGIDNRPPPEVVPRLAHVALTILEPLRAVFGCPIVFNGSLSWYRCAALNLAVGGAAHSQHVRGEAVDVAIAGFSNIEIAYFVRDHLPFDQLILENWDGQNPASGWVHVSAVADRPPRGEVLTFLRGRYSRGLP